MQRLIQRRVFSKKEFQLKKNSVFVKDKTWREYLEYEIPLDQLGLRLFTKQDKGPLLGLVFFGLMTVAMGYVVVEAVLLEEGTNKIGLSIALFLFMLLFSVIALLSIKNTLIYLVGGEQALAFFHNSPSKEEVNQFIDYVIGAKKEKLKSQILKSAFDMPEEYFESQLEWLIDNDIIDEGEFDTLKEEHRINRIVGPDRNN